MGKKMTAHEAVYQFAAMLTGRDDSLTVGTAHDAGAVAKLCEEFCQAHGLTQGDWDPSLPLEITKAVHHASGMRAKVRAYRQARQAAWQDRSSNESFGAWVVPCEVESLCSFIEDQAMEIQRLWTAIAAETEAIEQTLGRALGYGCDMRAVGGIEDDVCVGEHVPATLAAEAASAIATLKEQLACANEQVEFLQAELANRPKEG